uniref:NADH-ubiquinone oxidoreductase chain 4 n=1 Tax=Obrimoposthia wandeli TaxID=2136291 RepID=A0A7D5XYF0_9PLAT|nr:NADH dehydrogenase subunit 4 [Obrimoposthia wandeli]QLJ92318.1 NADH dehydrogenase subunit 4 [Obrimoposthia wandeli]
MWSLVFFLVFSVFFFDSCSFLFVISAFSVYFLASNNYFYFLFFSLKTANNFHDIFFSFFFLFSLFILLFVYFFCLNENTVVFNVFFVYMLVVFFFFYSSCNMIRLYIFFESSFVVILLFILFWGSNPERILASNYFLVYTLLGSVPLLFCIMMFFSDFFYSSSFFSYQHPANNFLVVGFHLFERATQWHIFFFWVLAFLIKLPVFGFHLWLPKAHVEAPVFGSMILAGILLKLGVFGLIRFFQTFFSFSYLGNNILVSIWVCFFLLGVVVLNLVCSRQYDLKSFVAYSSVVHMSLISISIWFGGYLSFFGSSLISFSHAFCSSALFLGVNCFYEISGSRNIWLNRGFYWVTPLLCFFWFLLCIGNCSAPFSLNLISEIILMGVSVNNMPFSWVFFVFNVFFSGFFCIFLYCLVSFGKKVLNSNFWISSSSLYYFSLNLLLHSAILYLFFVFFPSII